MCLNLRRYFDSGPPKNMGNLKPETLSIKVEKGGFAFLRMGHKLKIPSEVKPPFEIKSD